MHSIYKTFYNLTLTFRFALIYALHVYEIVNKESIWSENRRNVEHIRTEIFTVIKAILKYFMWAEKKNLFVLHKL